MQHRPTTKEHGGDGQVDVAVIAPETAPLLVDAAEAARLCHISRTLWFSLLASGRAPKGIRLGKCRRWYVEELKRWCAAGCPPRNRWELVKETGASAS